MEETWAEETRAHHLCSFLLIINIHLITLYFKRISQMSKAIIDRLKKIAHSAGTTPLYETIDPEGNRVTFTPASLVASAGKARSKSGKSFKLTKWKGKSLSDRVSGKDFGKSKKQN